MPAINREFKGTLLADFLNCCLFLDNDDNDNDDNDDTKNNNNKRNNNINNIALLPSRVPKLSIYRRKILSTIYTSSITNSISTTSNYKVLLVILLVTTSSNTTSSTT